MKIRMLLNNLDMVIVGVCYCGCGEETSFVKGEYKQYIQWHYNKDRSKETRQKISDVHKGKHHTEETKKKIGEKSRGRKLSEEWKRKISESGRGENHWNWRGGITPLYFQIRLSDKSIEWRNSVFKRDNFKCQKCGHIGVGLEAHHIKEFSLIIKEYNITTFESAMERNR